MIASWERERSRDRTTRGSGSTSRRRCRATSRPVVRLIVGGIAERVDFAFEEIDDLQLAVERLLAEAGTAGTRLPVVRGRRRTGSARASGRSARRRSPRRCSDGDGVPGPADAAAHPRRRSWTRSAWIDAGRRRHRRAPREAEGAGVSANARRAGQPGAGPRGGSRAAAPLPPRRRHRRAREADPAPPAAGALAGAPLRRPRRGARGHRAGGGDRADQGDRPLRARARGVARHLRHARTWSARSSATSATRAGRSACRARCRS